MMIKTLASTLLALLVLTPAAQAAYPGHNGRIVYQVDQSAQSMKPSGKDRVRLAKGNVSEPSVSPDARHVLFTRDPNHRSGREDVWVMRADGSHRKQLTSGKGNDSGPTFSPDGRRIAFSRSGTLWIMDADGSHQHKLAHDRSLYDPAFAPHGRTLVADGAGRGLFSVRLRDGRLEQLTDGRDYDPDFSPDGARIVFDAYRDTIETTELYVANADGSDVTRLTDDEHSDIGPVFSPDGTRIAFTHFTTSRLVGEDADVKEEGARITVADAHGGGAVELRPGFAPSWAPKAR